MSACTPADQADEASLRGCAAMITGGLLPIATERSGRLEAKVAEATALCRGGLAAVQRMNLPWVDWGNYFGAGDASSLAPGIVTSSGPLAPAARGVRGALLDLEYQRVELITFNLFDNNGTYRDYVAGRNGVPGPVIKRWESMRLPKDHPNYLEAGSEARQQPCPADLGRKRPLTGICNDIFNPLMGSWGQLFVHN